MRRRFPSILLAATVCLVAACGSDDDTSSTAAAPDATTASGGTDAPDGTAAPDATDAPDAPAGDLQTEITIAWSPSRASSMPKSRRTGRCVESPRTSTSVSSIVTSTTRRFWCRAWLPSSHPRERHDLDHQDS